MTADPSNDGPGVIGATKQRIFGMIEEGLDSQKSGIGLYLVLTIVDDFGGTVVEENAPAGALFVVQLLIAD